MSASAPERDVKKMCVIRHGGDGDRHSLTFVWMGDQAGYLASSLIRHTEGQYSTTFFQPSCIQFLLPKPQIVNANSHHLMTQSVKEMSYEHECFIVFY